jgi:hypothetical protein
MRLAGGLASSSGFQYPLAYSEVIISDTDTRFMTLETLTPAADGNTVTWDVGGVSNINETTEDDTTLNSSSTPGQVQQYTTNGLPAGTYGVLAVVLSGKMIGGTGGGPTQVEFGVRTGGVDAWGSDVLLPVSLQTVQYPFYVDPNTSSPFDPTNLGAGFNIGLKSVA